MACFIVPAVESVVVKAVEKHVENKEQLIGEEAREEITRIPLSAKLKWLTWMLWGGVILLAFEHIWHGEIVPYFPFLTAMLDPNDAMAMLHEMATVGVLMTVLITAVCGVVCLAADHIVKRAAAAKEV